MLRSDTGLFLWVDLADEHITMLQCVYPMTWVFSGQD